MKTTVHVQGLAELRARFKRFPQTFIMEVRHLVDAILTVFQEVAGRLGYPPPPPTSTYERTGTLGRTLGFGGQQPDIREIKQNGMDVEGSFGTRLHYAQYVVGERQAWMHQGRWWRLPVEVVDQSMPKIKRLANVTIKNLANFLRGKGIL